jgi:hypothetical protein
MHVRFLFVRVVNKAFGGALFLPRRKIEHPMERRLLART